MVREHIPKLLRFLRSENPDTVRYAVLALGNLATANPALVREARPELERLASSTDIDLAANAKMALSLL
jgi:DNA-binding IclR family transcriptional regulator